MIIKGGAQDQDLRGDYDDGKKEEDGIWWSREREWEKGNNQSN